MSALPHAAIVFGCAWLLDATLGEPPNALHPVVWMGRAIRPLKRLKPLAPALELALGGAYSLGVCFGFAGATWAAQRALAGHAWVSAVFEVHMLLGCFALKGLRAAGDQVRRALAAHDLPAARAALGSLCSRDASTLDARELAGAAIESVTENTSDSVVAPLFYYVVFGLPGAVFYRAANTLDAMVGYRGRFEYLGKTAARLDDLLNLVPARATALLLALSGSLLAMSPARGVSVWWRDRGRTESPNAGHPMAMGAGLLGVQLDKRECYVLGAGLADADAPSLSRALRLVQLSSWLCALAALIILIATGGRHALAL